MRPPAARLLRMAALLGGAILALGAPRSGQAQSDQRAPAAWLRLAVERLCRPEPLAAAEAEKALQGAELSQETPQEGGAASIRLERRYALPGGDAIEVEHFRPGGRLRRFTAVYSTTDASGSLTPTLQAVADGGCVLRAGRRIRREGPATAFLDQLDEDLETLRWSETLEAPWPDGADPGGPRVALVDSGLPYDLPLFADRLARGPDGAPLGYDFWDLDPYPYDADTARGPFLPIRHGGPVASIVVREATTAALVPLRYPRPDMSRMAAVVEHAVSAGARVLAMPLGSRNREDWTAFEAAMRAHPELLAIVSAGNDGRDIDAVPVYPASLDLPNLITVTSADDFGRLADGSNWGGRSVDLMTPAENQPVTDFRGAQTKASGSSYAVPRLAALAARLLEKQPALTTEQLKAAIFARAVPPIHDQGRVAVGWIADPARD